VVLTFYYRNEEGFKRVIEEVDLGTIEPGGTADGSVEWDIDETGLYTVGATVDVNDEVDEKEEGNNDESSLVDVKEEEDSPGPGVLMAILALTIALFLRRRRG
jgi:MYXO-CTERM domain-containing protein